MRILNSSQTVMRSPIPKEAFETLRERLELTPIYVYDDVQKLYGVIQCGSADIQRVHPFIERPVLFKENAVNQSNFNRIL
ncbi:hypothetical protein BSAF29S_01459 [Bacillus safensis subsp. safensis]